jgi:hypothetical protein
VGEGEEERAIKRRTQNPVYKKKNQPLDEWKFSNRKIK